MPPRYRPPRGNSHRIYEPGKRHMELIASVSRSSGLEQDGDALRDFKLQGEYREFIQGKLNDYWKRYPYGHTPKDTKHRNEMRSNVLILFRKLREGILSTKRNDAVALEVYETSMYLSVIFSTPVQTTSIISHLVPSMYKAHPNVTKSCQLASVTSLLHHLATGYPSQSRYSEHLNSIPIDYLPPSVRSWLRELARALRLRNFACIERSTNKNAMLNCLSLGTAEILRDDSNAPHDLEIEALATLLDTLRSKASATTWSILRSAYYELSCPIPSEGTGSLARDWLLRSLLLRNVAFKDDADDDTTILDTWIRERLTLGELKPKEGVEGRWIVCKVKK